MAGKISKETIAQLKADIRTVRPGKPSPFFYIQQNNDGDPVLLLGREAPRAFKSTLKDLKQKRFSKGTVTREGKMLTFQFSKAAPVRFRKHLRSYFAAVPALKAADIASGKARRPEAGAGANLRELTLAQVRALPNQKDPQVKAELKRRKTISQQGRQLTTDLETSRGQREQIESALGQLSSNPGEAEQARASMLSQLETILAQLEQQRDRFRRALTA